MIIRIVRLTFRSEETNNFEALFDRTCNQIRNFEGCRHLQLLRDKDNPNIYCTYSHWDNEQCLENYRNSAFFKDTWTQTKALFADKPLAFSVDQLRKLD